MKIFNNLMEEWNVDQRLIQKACRIFKNINLLMTSEILGKNKCLLGKLFQGNFQSQGQTQTQT